MLANLYPEQPENSKKSKIYHKSSVRHDLARFVTEEAVALMFNLTPEQIYRVECWQHIVYVYGKGISRFVSYADFPPIINVELPCDKDILRWRKRWRNQYKSKQAPRFWQQFYTRQFQQAVSVEKLRLWGELINQIKFVFSNKILEQLREDYSYQRSIKG